MPSEEDTYSVHIDGAWSLEDLYVFPRTYEQVYFTVYSFSPNLSAAELDRVVQAYHVFPWQGGYSAVNFYNQLKYVVPRRGRPTIASIRYESPGWIELALIVSVALNIEKIIKSVCSSLNECNQTYTSIVKGMQDRKLMRLESKQAEIHLREEHQKYVEQSAQAMAEIIHVADVDEIHSRTGHPYRSLKILLSLYRRIRTLAKYQDSGKADFSNMK